MFPIFCLLRSFSNITQSHCNGMEKNLQDHMKFSKGLTMSVSSGLIFSSLEKKGARQGGGDRVRERQKWNVVSFHQFPFQHLAKWDHFLKPVIAFCWFFCVVQKTLQHIKSATSPCYYSTIMPILLSTDSELLRY